MLYTLFANIYSYTEALTDCFVYLLITTILHDTLVKYELFSCVCAAVCENRMQKNNVKTKTKKIIKGIKTKERGYHS